MTKKYRIITEKIVEEEDTACALIRFFDYLDNHSGFDRLNIEEIKEEEHPPIYEANPDAVRCRRYVWG